MEIYTSSEWMTAQLWMAILCVNLLTYRSLVQNALPSRLRCWWTGSIPVSGLYEMWAKGRGNNRGKNTSEDEMMRLLHYKG